MLKMRPKRCDGCHTVITHEIIEYVTLKARIHTYVTLGVWTCDINEGFHTLLVFPVRCDQSRPVKM